jgi:hypothetical protein
MNNTPSQSQAQSSAESQEMTSMMFAQLVMQQSNMALIFLGKNPHPQTGQTSQDLEHARYFIDQLEMLEVKTRGNLDPHEDSLLKQSLTTLRLAFVDAASKPQPQPAAAENTPAKPESSRTAEPTAPDAEPAGSAESHKKFTKKY